MKKLLLLLNIVLISCTNTPEKNHSSDYYYNLGCLFYQEGDLKSAIDRFSTAIKIDYEYTNAYVNRANIFLEIY
tara:strand:+ start:192 stop:413 length:222 start_codon:yes stop_codon:yes gene_type:complete